MNNVFYLKTKIVVGEVSVIDNSRIQALRGNKEKNLHLHSDFGGFTFRYNADIGISGLKNVVKQIIQTDRRE